MAQTSYPFEAGSGAAVTESQWSDMARSWLGDGVLREIANRLEVYADSSGMQAKVKTGQAQIKGYHYKNDTDGQAIAVAAADPTNPRIDLIVLRLSWAANSIVIAAVTGTPAATPAAPALTQTDGTTWEIPLAQVLVDAAAVTIAAAKVTDIRQFAVRNDELLVMQLMEV